MYCNYCGKNIQDDARVCAYCGRIVAGTMPIRRLERSRVDNKIAGICGGMARYFGTDVTLMRLIWIIALVATVPLALIVYLVAWVIIPMEPEYVLPAHVASVHTPQ
ncbi:MAG TPA: PspC domain-containing protein [Terriglobales bacterium]|nr:PspC domain-containing protein [Terriglobales bacterium]